MHTGLLPKFYRIFYPDGTGRTNRTVEGGLATHSFYNVFKHPAVLYEGVWIVGGHNATHTKLRHADLEISDFELPPRPGSFCLSNYAADDDVGAQSSSIDAKILYSTIGGYEKRKNIEPSSVILEVQ